MSGGQAHMRTARHPNYLFIFKATVEAGGADEFQSKTFQTPSPEKAMSSFLPTHVGAMKMC